MSKVAPLGIAAGLALASSGASAFLEFGIDETLGVTGVAPAPGTESVEFYANQIGGRYLEVITFTGICGAGCFTFSTTAWAELTNYSVTQFVTGVPNIADAPAGGSGNYGLYGLFSSTGFVTGVGGANQTFVGTTADIELWLDPGADNTDPNNAGGIPPNGSTPFTVTDNFGTANIFDKNIAADVLLGTATTGGFLGGAGNLSTTGADFELLWNDFMLTAAGESFFVEPDPFHMFLQLDGFFNDPISGIDTELANLGAQCFIFGNNSVECAAAAVNGNLIDSQLTARFVVPEPATVALMGAALLGFGASRRKKS